MKKHSLKIGSYTFLFSLLFSACSSDATTVGEKTVAKVVDLNNFSYQDVKAALNVGAPIVLRDGTKEISIDHLLKADELQASTIDGAVVMYKGAEKDSVSISLTDKFIAVHVNKQGKEVGYVTYASQTEMDAVAKVYADMAVATKAEVLPVTRSASTGGSLKIDISGAQVANASKSEEVHDDQLRTDAATEAQDLKNAPLTSKADGLVFPRNGVVTINLLIGKGELKPISHELVWAQEKAQRSIKDVFRDDKAHAPTLLFKVQKCDYRHIDGHKKNLNAFKKFILNNKDKYPTAGKDIFYLMSWGGNGLIGGCAWTNVYNINKFSNPSAYGVSMTCCLFGATLAHELGHTFGAEHTSNAWYKLNQDLMNPTMYDWVGDYHRTDVKPKGRNRNIIYNNLLQR